MGKSAIFSILNGFLSNFKAYTKEVNDVLTSTMYSDEGRSELVSKLERKYDPIFHKAADRVEVELDSAVNQVKNIDGKASAAKLTDAGYQIGLANAVKMIETGSIKTVEDMQNIVNVYKNDRAALNLLAAAARTLPSDTALLLCSVIPEDLREKNIDLLERFKENFADSIRAAAMRRAESGFSIGELTESRMVDFDRMFDERCRLKPDYNGAESASIAPGSSSNV